MSDTSTLSRLCGGAHVPVRARAAARGSVRGAGAATCASGGQLGNSQSPWTTGTRGANASACCTQRPPPPPPPHTQHPPTRTQHTHSTHTAHTQHTHSTHTAHTQHTQPSTHTHPQHTHTPELGVKVDAARAQPAVLEQHAHQQRGLTRVGQELVRVPPRLRVACCGAAACGDGVCVCVCARVCVCVCVCLVGGQHARGPYSGSGTRWHNKLLATPAASSHSSHAALGAPVFASMLPSTPLMRAVSSSCSQLWPAHWCAWQLPVHVHVPIACVRADAKGGCACMCTCGSCSSRRRLQAASKPPHTPAHPPESVAWLHSMLSLKSSMRLYLRRKEMVVAASQSYWCLVGSCAACFKGVGCVARACVCVMCMCMRMCMCMCVAWRPC
jgi:hypothetical protein